MQDFSFIRDLRIWPVTYRVRCHNVDSSRLNVRLLREIIANAYNVMCSNVRY